MYLHLIRDADNHFVYSFECKMAKDLGPERWGCRREILDTWKIHQICSELRSSWCVIHEEKGDSLENNIRYHINIKHPVSRWSEIGYCLLSHSSYGILLWPPRQTNASLQQIHKLSNRCWGVYKKSQCFNKRYKKLFQNRTNSTFIKLNSYMSILSLNSLLSIHVFFSSANAIPPFYRSCSVII